jgi:hypothetical protein
VRVGGINRRRGHAATRIQGQTRRRQATQRVHTRRREVRATTINAGARGHLGRKHTRKIRRDNLELASATCIQRCWRARWRRRWYLAALAEKARQEDWGAMKIQGRFRVKKARAAVGHLRQEAEELRAVRFIQCQWRHRNMKQEQAQAATMIQNRFRCKVRRSLNTALLLTNTHCPFD